MLVTKSRKAKTKITDLGLSKVANSTSPLESLVGTPIYMAPEVFAAVENGSSYSLKSDCWSLGVVLYVLLCERHPFTGKCLQDGELKINLKADLWQNVSDAAKQMVLKLLVKDLDLRLSAEEILDDPRFRDDPATCEDARSTL